MKTINVTRRSPVLLNLVKQARSEGLIVKTNDGCEYAMTAIHDADYRDAKRRLSEVVMAYLDELGKQGKLPPLEVVFIQNRPRRSSGGEKRTRLIKKA